MAAGYRFAPGQFNMLYVPGFGESAISISSDPSQHDLLSHTIRVAGNVTQAIARKKVGDDDRRARSVRIDLASGKLPRTRRRHRLRRHWIGAIAARNL